MDDYSAFRRKGVLTPAPTWLDLEDPVLSEIRQTQKDKACMTHTYEVPRGVRFVDMGGRVMCAREGGACVSWGQGFRLGS